MGIGGESGHDMTMDVRIVPMSETYTAGFHTAVDAVARERRYLALIEAPPIDQTVIFVQALLAGGGVQMVALGEDDRVVGWCDIVRGRGEGLRHAGRLGMGLLPLYRGQGHGRRLADTTIAAAWASGIERIELEVFASNTPAIRLYETLGFQREGLKRHWRKLDGIYDDNVVMARLADESVSA